MLSMMRSKRKGRPGPMQDILQVVAFVAVWILLQRVILPRMGIGT